MNITSHWRLDLQTFMTAAGIISRPWTWLPGVFPARTYPTPARGSVLTGPEVGSGGRCGALFANFDHDSQSWRTLQGCLIGGWSAFSGRWPRTGSMRNGQAFQHAPLVRHIHGTGCSFWPTPRASDRDNCGGSNARQKAKRMGTYIGRNQNPQVSEWLMGFPKDWSALPPSETPLFRKSPSG